jgi:uncharacterized membrane protein YjfL (UPF0719 family)
MVDIGVVLTNMGLAILWAIVGGVSLAIVAPIAIKIFDIMTKDIDEIAELKKGNVAIGLVLAAVILGMSFIVGVAIF